MNKTETGVSLFIRSMQNLIVIDPEIMSGEPCFAGTRVPVKNLFDYLETDETIESFLDDFPTVSREQALKVLDRSEALLISEEAAA